MNNTRMEHLDEIIDETAYVGHSFTETLVSGRVPVERLRAWAVQKYHQTFEQNRGFSFIHAVAPYEDVRQWEMEQLIAEETTLRDGSEAHYNLMKRFAIALGAGEDLDGTPAAPQVRAFLDYLLNVCRNEHFVYGLLAFYVNERQTPAAVQKMYDHLTGEMGMSPYDTEWFQVHGEVDIRHSDGARTLIMKYAGEAPGFNQRAAGFVRRGCAQWRQLQNFYYSLIAR